MKKLTMLVIGMLTLGAESGLAATFFVDASRPDDSGAGASWATAKKTIQAAVDALAAAGGGTVWATNGVYSLGGAAGGGASNIAVLATNMALRGLNGPEVTIIDGGRTNRCVYVPTNATLEGFTVRNGYAGNGVRGGGIYVANGGTVSNCIIESNIDDESNWTINPGGGGIYLHQGGVVERCIVRNNVSDYAGGGAALNEGGTLRNCVFHGNSGFSGGGVNLYLAGTMIHCTLAGNTAANSAGGLYFYNPATMAVFNNTIYGNSGGAEWATFLGSSLPTGATNNCTTPSMGANCVTSAPTYVDAASRNYRMTMGSSCIDAGVNLPSVTSDLDGTHRPVDGTLDGTALWDIGAYEFEPATNPPGLSITSPVDYEVLPWTAFTTTVAGTGHDIVGLLAWTNAATGASGQLNAGSPWTVNGVALAEGTNRWRITGTNVYGQTASAIVRIVRGGLGTPVVVPATNEVNLPFSIVTLSGSNNAHVAGTLAWSNTASGLSGTLAVTPTWGTTIARLSDGPNPIVFVGTNLLGASSSATVTVTRTPYLVRYVSPSGSSQAPYTNWATAATNIDLAVAAAQDGDEVIVTAGTWYVVSPLRLTNGIIVRSVPNTSPVIRPLGGAGRCVLLNHPAAILDGFYIRYGNLGNDEGYGAGILCSNGIVQNCLVTDCSANDGGGGVNMVGGTIQNCTICTNKTWYYTATGMRCSPGVAVVNCIIRFNYPLGSSSELNVQNLGATFANCATAPAIGTGCVTNDPLFVNPSGRDYRLRGASPCVDSGADLSNWTVRDLPGRVRPLEGPGGPPTRYDIGAYEFAPFITASAGAHGTIVPAGEIPIDIGGSTSFVVTANTYYHIGSLLTNGADDAAAGDLVVYTSVWNIVRYEGTVAASFAENLAALGTPEWWLAQYGWTNNFDYWETNDTDSDLFQAWQEQIAGTDPTNENSFFQCLDISETNFPMIGKVLRWDAVTARRYSIDGSTNLPESWFELATNLPPTGVWTDTVHGGDGMINYRLGVRKE